MDFAEVVHPTAVGFDDFQIFLVDPNDAIEKGVLTLQGFRGNLEDKAIDLVHFFGVEIFDVVFGKLVDGNGKCRDTRESLSIFGLERKVLQRSLRGGDGFLVELAVAGTNGVIGGNVLAGGLAVGTEFLNANGFAISELRASGKIQFFFFGESLNDLFRRQGRWRSGLDAFDAGDVMFGRRSERARRVFLRVEWDGLEEE